MRIGNCTNCFQEKEFYRGKRCRECVNEIERKRFKERNFKKDLSYVECSNSECNAIYKFVKRNSLSQKTYKGKHPKYEKRNSLTYDDIIFINTEMYVKHDCPKCGSEPLIRYEQYEPKFLSWCKTEDEEIKEIMQLIDIDSIDAPLLRKEYKELTGRKYQKGMVN